MVMAVLVRRRSARRHTTTRSRCSRPADRSEVRHQARRRRAARQRRHRHARSRMGAAPRQIQSRNSGPRARALERGHPSVRTAAVQRAARRRKQPVEIRRVVACVVSGCRSICRPHRSSVPNVVSRIVPPPLHRIAMPVAIGRRVDQDQQPFSRSPPVAASASAILRADINGRAPRQAADAGKYRRIRRDSRAEKNTLWRISGNPSVFADHRPGHRRQRPRFARDRRRGAGGRLRRTDRRRPRATSALSITASACDAFAIRKPHARRRGHPR